MKQQNPLMSPLCAAILIFAVVAPLTSAESDSGDLEGTIVVEANETLLATGPLAAQSIIVYGTIETTAGGLILNAETIELAAGSLLRGYDGAQGTSVEGVQAYASDGQPGQDVVIMAQSLRMAPGATIQAGSGGGAGSAVASYIAEGGNGGHGGDIHIFTEEAELDGALLPGAGGDGGDAFTATHGRTEVLLANTGHASGGHGGASGQVYLQGVVMEAMVPEVEAPDSTQAVAPRSAYQGSRICSSDAGEGEGYFALTRRKPLTMKSEKLDAVSDFDISVKYNLFETRSTCDRVSGGDDDDGGGGSGPIDPSDLPTLPGVPGAGDTGGCTVSDGTDGAPNYLGDGGDGGDGCSSAVGTSGADGSRGNDGTWGCTDGGNGSSGASASSLSASGGDGGMGTRSGGDGGMASSLASGGPGGSGGDGGKATLNTDCAGGDGGNGGSGTSASANGGNGGLGLCGPGGAKGIAQSTANAGGGGAGGAGNPAGLAGLAGTATSGASNNGRGGDGSDTC